MPLRKKYEKKSRLERDFNPTVYFTFRKSTDIHKYIERAFELTEGKERKVSFSSCVLSKLISFMVKHLPPDAISFNKLTFLNEKVVLLNSLHQSCGILSF